MSRYRFPIGALTAAVAALALAGSTAAVAAPGHQTSKAAAATTKTGDVDGDGYDDLAVGAPNATVKTFAKAGYLAMTYGSTSGITIGRHLQITQSSPGVPGTPEAGDRFGSAVAVADVDGDGYADLVAGSSGEAIGTVQGAGSISVVFGSKTGLSGQGIAFHPATPVAKQGFGSNLTVGDFNHDGRQDIATVVAGKLDLVYGAANLRTTAPTIKTITPADGFVLSGAVSGDINGDGYADIVTHGYHDDPADEGAMRVLPGSASGVKTTALGNDVGLPFADYRTVTGDINGDGKDDVVVDTSFSDGPDDFKLRTFPGSATGLGSSAAVVWSGPQQNGIATRLADIDGDGHADLVVSDVDAADSDGISGAGAITVLKGTANWLTDTGAQSITLDTPGVAGVSEGNNRFGSAIVSGDYNGDNRSDLALGVPGKDYGDGAVSMLYADSDGLTPTGSILFHSDSLGIPVARDGFGTTLGAGPQG
jgi:FG-GAP repeat/FG-GAP-like repeat